MISFLGLAFAIGKQKCGSRLPRKCAKHSYSVGLLLSFFRCSSNILLRYIVVVTHTRKKVSASLCENILNSGVIYYQGSQLAFEWSHAAPAANYSKVPKTCRQLKYKSGASEHLTDPEIKLPVCPCPEETLLSGMH